MLTGIGFTCTFRPSSISREHTSCCVEMFERRRWKLAFSTYPPRQPCERRYQGTTRGERGQSGRPCGQPTLDLEMSTQSLSFAFPAHHDQLCLRCWVGRLLENLPPYPLSLNASPLLGLSSYLREGNRAGTTTKHRPPFHLSEQLPIVVVHSMAGNQGR